ncbi:MAG TPA: glycosyltransferase [Acidimicrobiales bacterium]|nr:glycosyltransferase [Acidimicrobiales bacterium]
MPAGGGGRPRISVVVPAYQEAGVIGPTLERLRGGLAGVAGARSAAGGLELVVADDGSTDSTAEEAAAAGADRVLRLAHRGKGAAVRTGILAATGRTVAFCDADLAYAPDQVLKVTQAVESGFDVAVGSRRHVDAVTLVRAGRLREVSGRVFSILTDTVLVGSRHDTQCGIKAFSDTAARQIFSRARIDGFAFDVEIFVLVDRLGLSLTDVAVELTNSRRSSVRVVPHSLGMLRDVARVRWGLARGHYSIGGRSGPAREGSPGAFR